MFFKYKEESQNKLQRAIKKELRPGANIMVMGIGGAGRNAVRNMSAIGLDSTIELLEVDTDMSCDKKRYGNAKGGVQ